MRSDYLPNARPPSCASTLPDGPRLPGDDEKVHDARLGAQSQTSAFARCRNRNRNGGDQQMRAQGPMADSSVPAQATRILCQESARAALVSAYGSNKGLETGRTIGFSHSCRHASVPFPTRWRRSTPVARCLESVYNRPPAAVRSPPCVAYAARAHQSRFSGAALEARSDRPSPWTSFFGYGEGWGLYT